MLAGGITVLLWRQGEGGWFELYEMIPGVLAAVLALLLGRHLGGERAV